VVIAILAELLLPSLTPAPPLNVPVSYFSQGTVFNDPPANTGKACFPFGRPQHEASLAPPVTGRDPSRLFEPCQKVTLIRRPSDTWAMTDCDQQFMTSIGVSSASYFPYVPAFPVHSGKSPARRNYLYYDWSVRSLATPQ